MATKFERCGFMTASGKPCRRVVAEAPCGAHRGAAMEARPDQMPAWELAQWVARALAEGRMEAREAMAFTSVVRLLHALGPDEDNSEQVEKEGLLHGRIWHGIPPRSEEEWALAEAVFDAESVAELRRWPDLFALRAPTAPVAPVEEWADEVDWDE